MSKDMEKKPEPPIEVPIGRLSPEILDAVIEEYILREGTDYGAVEVSLARKKEQVFNQLQKNKIKIVFDASSATVTLITAE